MTPLQPNNKCLTSVATGECLFVAKARADLGVGPGGPAPPPLLSGIFFFCKRVSDVQYGIQAFAKFKRPECTRLHLRELSENFPGGACAYPGCQRLLSHARKTSGTQGSMRPKLPTKVHRSQSCWALSRPYCHWVLYLWAPSITKSSVRPCEVFLFRIKSDCYLKARSLSRILYFRQVLTLVDAFDCLGP